MINLKDFPKSSGVYWIVSNEEIIYVGSSKDLYRRMLEHNRYIKKGCEPRHKTKLYQFLQTNQFTVHFQLETNYRQLEQHLIEQYNPKYNQVRAYTGITSNGNRTEYRKEHRHKFHEEHLETMRKYRESNKEKIKQQNNQYYKQLCNYNGEILTLNALKQRFLKQGVEHSFIEAKKYLI